MAPFHVVLVAASLFSGWVARMQPDALLLKQGQKHERTLAPAQAHAYTLAAKINQRIRFIVEQQGIDVVIRVTGPDGKKLGEFDSPNGTMGPEPVSFIAEKTGTYRFEVSALDPRAKEGKYEARLEEQRAATPLELKTARAEKEVLAADDSWEDAVGNARVPSMDRLMAEDYQNFEGRRGPPAASDKAAFLAPYRDGRISAAPLKAGERKGLDRAVRIFGDTAVVVSLITFEREVSGVHRRDVLRVHHLWQKRNSEWQLVGDMVYRVDQSVLDRKPISVPAHSLNSLAGTYDIELLSGTLTIGVEGDHLTASYNGGTDKFAVFPLSESEYFDRPGDLLMTFARDGRGAVTAVLVSTPGVTYRAVRR